VTYLTLNGDNFADWIRIPGEARPQPTEWPFSTRNGFWVLSH